MYSAIVRSFIISGIFGITKLTLCDPDSNGKINVKFQRTLIRVLYLVGKLRNINLELYFFHVFSSLGGGFYLLKKVSFLSSSCIFI